MTTVRMTRREFGISVGASLAAVTLSGACGAAGIANDGRLTARPRKGITTSASGEHPLGLGGRRDAILQIPSKASGPLPLLVLFHGAGGSGANMLHRLGTAPDEAGVAVLSPDSRGSTWDAIRGTFDADVAFVNQALERVFATVAVDPARITLGGFSDGATYALSLGLINGDWCPRILACSAGFIVERTAHGKPKIFMSHGTADEILPIDRCGRPIAAALKKQGYDVTFREFNGGHEVPPDVAREAMRWVAAR